MTTSRTLPAPPCGPPAHREDGFSTVELVVLAPVFVLFLLLVVVLGRVQQAGADLTGAARDGARAASLARTAAQADSAAHTAVDQALTAAGVSCTGGWDTTVDTAGFVPGGQVGVTVRCQVPLADIGLSLLPGSTSLSRSSVSPIESYRSVS